MYRIAFIGRSWWPDIRGGSERFIHNVAVRMARRGFSVNVITRLFRVSEEDFIREMRGLGVERVVLVRTGRIKFISNLLFSLRASSVVNRIKPDAVIVNGYWSESSPLYIDRSIKTVAVIHDLGFLDILRTSGSSLNKLPMIMRGRIIKRVAERVDRIIVPSEAVKRDLVEFLGRDPGKIHVLGVLGVDGPFAYEHVENDVIDILHPARFSPNKAQDLSMKAVKILARRYENIRLWLVGGRGVTRADQEYLERIYRDAEEINRELGREVIRVVVDARDIGEFYRLADICLIPSTWSEGYGLTVIECMAYGKPVIASDLFRETGAADDERAYIVRRGDLEALTQALEHVINNRSEALEKALKALDFVRRNCSWDEVARRIEIILSDMIERRTE